MLIESLALDDRIKQLIIEKDGIKQLYPPQSQAIQRGLLTGKNFVIAIPTASGKTLLAELTALKHVIELGGKAIYLCPLRALASEKYNNLKRFNSLGVRIAVTSGDYDSNDSYLSNYDIIVSTNEKMDALLRHQASWVAEQVSLVIIDECHLINDQHRGPTLETLLARLMLENSQAQLIALSATVGNADELAEWLDAELIQSDWRPVPLKEGVYFEDQVNYSDFSSREIPFRRKDQLVNIALDSFYSQEQVLIFTPSRRSAVTTAEKIGKVIEPEIKTKDSKNLADISSQAATNLTDPLSLKLAETIKRGVTFHHAGLNSRQRELVETAFKNGYIKILCATPTLCLSQDTFIWHGLSQTKITQLNTSQQIIALSKERLVPIKAQGINILTNEFDLIKISSVAGYSIKVTPNHKILVKRNGNRLVLPAAEILSTDRIATIGRLKFNTEYQFYIKDFVEENKTDLGSLEFNQDLAYFIGLMLGDGHSGTKIKNNKIVYKGSPSIVNTDNQIIEFCKKICNTLNINYREDENQYGTPQLVLSKTKWFREFLVRCGVETKNKRISRRIMKLSKEKVSYLLRGLFDTDGYVNKGRNIGFTNSSEKLIYQVRVLLLRFGIVATLRKKRGSTIQINGKEYKTRPSFELIITNKKCLIEFHKSIGFRLQRKQKSFNELIKRIQTNLLFSACLHCEYKIYRDLFSGHTESHKEWGSVKLRVIKLLGEKGELGSREIVKSIGFEPKKPDRRLNHHYELIKKRKIGSISKTEWFWSLNVIGEWIYKELLSNDEKSFDDFFSLQYCPICGELLDQRIKKGWRNSDFEGDIFWDIIRSIKKVNAEPWVYDLVLRDNPKNDHMFVANGFIVHNSSGINLPAKRVVISSVYRYSIEEGSHPIKTLEYKQMIGRAGRPQFDNEGESLLLAKQDRVLAWLMERYILRDPEAIYSKLAAKPALRRNILGLIASRVVNTVPELLSFFEKTFYGFQYEAVLLESKIREVIDLLIIWEMINPLDANETLVATPYGRRISHLYLDPETGASLAEGLEISITQKEKKGHSIGFLDLIVGTPDMIELAFHKRDFKRTEERLKRFTPKLIKPVPDPLGIDYEFRLQDFKTVLFLWDWIREIPIEQIISRYNIGSGDIKRIVDTATWLISAISEIAELKGRENTRYKLYAKKARSLSERVTYGIKSDAVSLTRVKGIGRKRARLLLDHGIRDITQLRAITAPQLSQIPGFGIELAKSILNAAAQIFATESPTTVSDSTNGDIEDYIF